MKMCPFSDMHITLHIEVHYLCAVKKYLLLANTQSNVSHDYQLTEAILERKNDVMRSHFKLHLMSVKLYNLMHYVDLVSWMNVSNKPPRHLFYPEINIFLSSLCG
jgi:hypothetical protein